MTNNHYDVKQVIVIRKDLKMRRGKEIAQGSHASIAFLTARMFTNYSWTVGHGETTSEVYTTNDEREWIQNSFAKVCVRVNSEQELLDIEKAAKEAKLEVNIIKDSGHTEFGGVPTYTCLAIGPNKSEDIDKITGHLELY
jgi:PTH2 family peptidyl-tRNA hydrolase